MVQRMTQEEAKAVLRLHGEDYDAGGTSTADVAEALRLPESEVETLLERVRREKEGVNVHTRQLEDALTKAARLADLSRLFCSFSCFSPLS